MVVANVAPTPTIPSIGGVRVEGTPIAVAGAATDPAGANDTLSFAWAVFKNGAAYAAGSGAGYTFAPNDNGSCRVALTVSDEDGGSTTVDQTIVVANATPSATIVGAPAASPQGVGIALGE